MADTWQTDNNNLNFIQFSIIARLSRIHIREECSYKFVWWVGSFYQHVKHHDCDWCPVKFITSQQNPERNPWSLTAAWPAHQGIMKWR